MSDSRLLENFDWIFLALILALASLGILNLYSASSSGNAVGTPAYIKQFYWLIFGLGTMTSLLFFDYHRLGNLAYVLYGVGLVLLVIVLGLGQETSGSQRWIRLGFFNLQPSELIKVFVIITLARYFARREYPEGLGFKNLLGPAVLVGIPFLLIIKQPDLGTALHLAFACMSVLLFLRIRPMVLITVSATLAITAPFIWRFLEPYQIIRIVTFLNPEKDPLGAGYHIIQSKIAVGSGQFWGKGFLRGTQNQLRFLPEQHTDFVFSVFAEEWGFFGSSVMLILFFFLVLYGINIARRSQDRFGALLALGLTALIFWQFFINISMVTGLMPVVGLPLPFISYGGSSLVTTLMACGLILNIGMRRYMFQEN